jgi:hypothetical protein
LAGSFHDFLPCYLQTFPPSLTRAGRFARVWPGDWILVPVLKRVLPSPALPHPFFFITRPLSKADGKKKEVLSLFKEGTLRGF